MERKGDWILTYTGVEFYPADPRPEEINISDIAHALSNLCRFGGHTEGFYSVAEHSVLVSTLVPPELALVALMHDASEAYLVDLPRPIKQMEGMEFYRNMEDNLQKVICEVYELPYPYPEPVHRMDRLACFVEAHELMQAAWADKEIQELPFEVPPFELYRLRPELAKVQFLNRYQELTGNARNPLVG